MPDLSAFAPDHLAAYLVVAALLFAIGVACVLVRRNAIGVLIGIELMLNAAALNVAAFGRFHADGGGGPGLLQVHQAEAQAMALVIIVLAAAEASVALALLHGLARTRRDIDLAAATGLRG